MKTAVEILNEKGADMICVSPDTTIFDTLNKMLESKIGAILVKDGDKIVGIWTERDLMRNAVEPGFDPKTAKIGDYMTTDLLAAPYNATVYYLKDQFLGRRLRHLLIERDGEYIGILSTGDVIRASLYEKDQELRNLNAIVSWDYYEDWRWGRKKK